MIVLDVNAAYAMVDGAAEGLGMKGLMLEGEKTIAPTLFCSESANVAWKNVRFGSLDRDRSVDRMMSALGLVDEFYPDESMMAEAVDEALARRHSVYDMFYLVLARRTGATLFTLDKKLVEICREAKVNCIEEVAI